MDRIRSLLVECKLVAMIGGITAVVWVAGYSANLDQKAKWLDRLPAPGAEQDHPLEWDMADVDELPLR